MEYCGICRIEKRKRQALGGLEAEANRTPDNPKDFPGSDIDWTRTGENVRLVSADDWWEHIKADIDNAGAKLRKDSVVMLDGLYTASPEFFKDKSKEEMEKYFRDCLQFHIEAFCHGDASLVKNAVIHYDETTPHMQVCSVPLTEDGRLCAKEIMGNKKAYHLKQDAFYEKVTKNYGLERGEIAEYGLERRHKQQATWKAIQAEERAEKAEVELETVTKALNASKSDLKATKDTIEASKDIIEEIENYNDMSGKSPEEIEDELDIKRRKRFKDEWVEMSLESFQKLVDAASVNDRFVDRHKQQTKDFNENKKQLHENYKKATDEAERTQKAYEAKIKSHSDYDYNRGFNAGVCVTNVNHITEKILENRIEDDFLEDDEVELLRSLHEALAEQGLTFKDLDVVKENKIDAVYKLSKYFPEDFPQKHKHREDYDMER